MAHELDFTTGNAAIAYRGDLPWHGFGETITSDDTLETMMEKAKLNWHVIETDAFYSFEGELRKIDNRKALIRSDSGDWFSNMSENRYEVRQPETIVNFFRDLCDFGGYEIETLGALFGGRKVWCLAKRKGITGNLGDDIINPYILLTDSYDGTLATTAQATSVRVVCNNTLSWSLNGNGKVKLGHNQKFDEQKIKDALAANDAGFADYLESMRKFGQVKMTDEFKTRFFLKLFTPPKQMRVFGELEGKEDTWKRSKLDFEVLTTQTDNTVAELMRLSKPGNAPGSQFQPNTLFNALQTVTYFVDHETRTKNDLRWQSAIAGNGARTKESALELAMSLVD